MAALNKEKTTKPMQSWTRPKRVKAAGCAHSTALWHVTIVFLKHSLMRHACYNHERSTYMISRNKNECKNVGRHRLVENLMWRGTTRINFPSKAHLHGTHSEQATKRCGVSTVSTKRTLAWKARASSRAPDQFNNKKKWLRLAHLNDQNVEIATSNIFTGGKIRWVIPPARPAPTSVVRLRMKKHLPRCLQCSAIADRAS